MIFPLLELFTEYEKDSKEKIVELENVIKELRKRIESLEDDLKSFQNEKLLLEQRHSELVAEREEEKKKITETLDLATKQKAQIELKWKEDFEKLRTVNILKEQQLLDDFEWKLREVQQTCRKKLDDKDKDVDNRLQNAYKEADDKMREMEIIMGKVI